MSRSIRPAHSVSRFEASAELVRALLVPLRAARVPVLTVPTDRSYPTVVAYVRTALRHVLDNPTGITATPSPPPTWVPPETKTAPDAAAKVAEPLQDGGEGGLKVETTRNWVSVGTGQASFWVDFVSEKWKLHKLQSQTTIQTILSSIINIPAPPLLLTFCS